MLSAGFRLPDRGVGVPRREVQANWLLARVEEAPDLNAIERVFAKPKADLRKAAKRYLDDL